jgi:DNA helicase-2/ATP-dependent DNA helicase PcrA
MEFGFQYTQVQDFLSELALLTSVSAEDLPSAEERETVKLSTIHQAKGLEWPVVFIISLTEGNFPNPRNINRQEDEEEERRLFYVAVTRAKDHLYLCSPRWRIERNAPVSMLKPSRFLREIPEQCFQRFAMSDNTYDF